YIYRMDRPRNMKVGEDATLVRQLAAQDGAIFALDWSSDGTRVAVAGAGPSVNIYDAETGKPLASCTGHAAGIYAVAFSPDSTHRHWAARCKAKVAPRHSWSSRLGILRPASTRSGSLRARAFRMSSFSRSARFLSSSRTNHGPARFPIPTTPWRQRSCCLRRR